MDCSIILLSTLLKMLSSISKQQCFCCDGAALWRLAYHSCVSHGHSACLSATEGMKTHKHTRTKLTVFKQDSDEVGVTTILKPYRGHVHAKCQARAAWTDKTQRQGVGQHCQQGMVAGSDPVEYSLQLYKERAKPSFRAYHQNAVLCI